MKFKKVWLSGLLMLVLFGYFTLSTAYAQSMDIWKGKWFKMTVKNSGYVIEYPESHSRNKSETVYLKIWDVDQTNKVLKCDFYNIDEGEWISSSIDLNYFGHNNLEFLCWLYYSNEREGENIEIGAMAFLIQGKMSQGSLASAKLKSLGGVNLIVDWNSPGYEYFRAQGVTITGSLMDASKVPVPPDKILH